MGYLIAGVVLILLMAVLSFVFFKKDIHSIIAIVIFYVMYLVLIPSDFKHFGVSAFNLAMGSSGEAIRLLTGGLAYLIVIGFILGAMTKIVRVNIKGKRELIDIIRGVGALILIVVTALWIISFSIDVISLLSMNFVIPNLYNITLWTILAVIILGTGLINIKAGLSLSTPNVPSIGSRNRSERNADVLLYKDDLESLDVAVLNGEVKKNRYAQIISDIEVDKYKKGE